MRERDELARALQSAEARYRAIYDVAPDMLATVDRHTAIIVDCNQTLADTLGYRKAELIGTSVFALYHPDCLGRAREVSRTFVRTGQIRDVELLLRSKGGRALEVSLSVSPIRDEGDAITESILVLRDISERAKARTALAEARDDALAAATAKSTFLATMSHEIRTPMNAVIGMTGLLLDTELSAQQRDFAETVRGSGEALLEIINDVLDYSKIEAGKLRIETFDFDLRTTIDEVVHLLAQKAHAKGLELAALIEPAVPLSVAGDAGRLRQILLNLTSNALKFTDRGEIVVRTTLESESASSAVVRIAVSDTGPGISAEGQGRLFRPFSQVDDSSTREHGGTGLGLAISRQLVEAMGGAIGVESTVGTGSTFWFTLRVEKRASVSPAAVGLDALDGMRVLAVDDNATNWTLVEQQLAGVGMRVDPAASATDALDRMRRAHREGAPFRVALLDFQMPHTDGIELARAIKAEPALASCALILLTSTAQRGHAAKARAAGFAGYLTKPIRMQLLVGCIRSVLGQETASPDRPAAVQLVTKHRLAELSAGAKPRVLLAEDNVINQKVAVLLLQKLGYRADVAANGHEAIDAVRRVAYQAVLMDCQMPACDGYEATAGIRRLPAPQNRVPIIAMTANAMQGDRERCLASGMDDYVAKPVKPDSLEAALTRVIVGREDGPASQTLDPSIAPAATPSVSAPPVPKSSGPATRPLS